MPIAPIAQLRVAPTTCIHPLGPRGLNTPWAGRVLPASLAACFYGYMQKTQALDIPPPPMLLIPLPYGGRKKPCAKTSLHIVKKDVMTPSEIMVTLLGLGAIAWVNYWFFWARGKHD